MAVTFRAAGTAFHSGSATTVTLSKPASTQQGDYMIAFLHAQSSTATVDWSAPAGWTKIGPAFTAQSSPQRVTSTYAKFAGSSEPSTYDFTSPQAGTRLTAVIHSYTGVDPTTPVVAHSGFAVGSVSTASINILAFSQSTEHYTVQIMASQHASPYSYALASNPNGLTLLSEVFRASGATQNPPSEDTTVSRTAMRIWGGIAPSGGITAHTITLVDQFAQACSYMIALNAAGGTSMPTVSPTIIGHTTATSSGTSSTITINPSTNLVGIPPLAGDWILAVFMAPSAYANINVPTPPNDWTNIVPLRNMGLNNDGTATFAVWAHKRAAGETTYSWPQTTGAQNTYHRLIYVRDAGDIANWIIGSTGTRDGVSPIATTTIPGITTYDTHRLSLLIAGERTIAAETDNQVTCDNFTKQWFDNVYDQTLFVATKDMPAAGTSGSVTVTYPNTHNKNGIGLILGIQGVEQQTDPTGIPQRIGYVATDTDNTAASSITLDPGTPTEGGSIANDDWMIAFVAANDSSTITPPAGWTALNNSWGVIGTYRTKVYARKRVSGDTSYTFTASTVTYINAALLWVRHADNVINWVVGIPKKRTDSPAETTTITAPSITTAAVNSLALSFGFERTLADEAGVAWSGANQWFFTPQHGSSIVTFAVGYKAMATTGATGDTVITYPNSQTNNGWGYQIAIPVAPVHPGLPIKVSDGASLQTAYFQLADGVGGFVAPGAYKVLKPGYSSVTQMLAQAHFYCAHRGGSYDYPEMSMYAYGQTALLGYPALELSLARSSDGIWFGLHDASLDRTSFNTGGGSGTTYVAASMTWAQIQSYNILGAMAGGNPGQPNRPYMRWEEIIALYYPSHVIFVDPKVAVSYRTELLNMMDALPGTPTDHFVGKYYGVSGGPTGTSGWNYDCHQRGYKTWGYFYNTDSANYTTYAPRWDILGMNYTATQTYWDQLAAAAPGKPIMGHICPDAGSVTTAFGKGAAGVMVSGVKANIPPAIT